MAYAEALGASSFGSKGSTPFLGTSIGIRGVP